MAINKECGGGGKYLAMKEKLTFFKTKKYRRPVSSRGGWLNGLAISAGTFFSGLNSLLYN